MAQKVEVLLVDDIDGGEADETVTFSLDGITYEIDLSKKNAARLREGLEPFVAGARKARKSAGRPVKTTRTAGNRERSAEIREWAKSHNIAVNERGRIPATVIEKFEAAH
ncbi:histone-like nucleoid-structuring protein Lsr2 [Actinomadura macrotermitis]|uniref:Nucleoid-associated protein Lsr2 n=1 Tax=Actinomadura macrotermitis TaxID=2585200 RepID=A0A7K0C7E6_9ACTN|nr:Lsr2 family protein [Actinomadura macrotermitis]MQY08694.1 Nucleoid-associated protein Lsr2 [Actinomadura macrotermitis]